MVDGRYQITMQTPIGVVQGFLNLKTDGEKLSGSLEAMGGRHPFSGGKAVGDQCSFTAGFQTPYGKINLQVNGRVQGDVLQASAKTQLGMIQASGRRVGTGNNRRPSGTGEEAGAAAQSSGAANQNMPMKK